MRLPSRLSILAAVVIAGLASTLATSAAAASPPHARPAASPTSSTGTTALWTNRLKDGQGVLEGFANAVSPDGSTVYVTGNIKVNKPYPHGSGVTVAYNSGTGAVLWQTQYPAPKNRNFSFSNIAVSPDGSTVYVVGEATKFTFVRPTRWAVAAYSASTGALIWSKTEPGGDVPNEIAVSPDGATVFMLAGTTMVAYDASTGTVLWTDTVQGGQVAVSPNGSAVFVLAGQSVVTAYNPTTGAVLWTAPIGFLAEGLAVSPNGSTLFLTGSATSSPGYYHYQTAALNAATGAQLWATSFRRAGYIGMAAAVAVSPDGSTVFITGQMLRTAGPSTYRSWGTVAYDATTGAQLWVVHFSNRIQNIRGISIATSPDGSKVFVAGSTAAKSGAEEIGTAAYDAATGALLWIDSYHPAGFSGIGKSIAVSPDGSKVFTTGAIWPGLDNENYSMVTAAYNS
jgi:outer membrane protein assembly factor BamB